MAQGVIVRFFRFLVLLVVVVLFVASGTFFVAKNYWNPFDVFGDDMNTRVVYTIKGIEEVALLSLGVQEIENASEEQRLLNIAIPGTTKKSDVQFSFQAKLGINGKDVAVKELGGNEFLINVPEFQFIGMDNLDVQVLNEDNGVLSWITPDIDRAKMLEEVVNADLQKKYIDSNEEILRQQTENFYRGVVSSIAPNATIEFEFAGD